MLSRSFFFFFFTHVKSYAKLVVALQQLSKLSEKEPHVLWLWNFHKNVHSRFGCLNNQLIIELDNEL